MEPTCAITVTYWAEQTGNCLIELEGIDAFRRDLDANYVAVVQARPGDLGGLYDLAVEFVTNFTLRDTVKLILEGVAFDLIKSGTRSFVLRPFLTAYRALRERNPGRKSHGDIDRLRITFADSVVTIYNLGEDSIADNIEVIFRTLAEKYAGLNIGTGEAPFAIHVPVFEDQDPDRICHYRVLLDVDETINDRGPANYLKLWGLWYDFARVHRIYDVKHDSFIDEEFYELDRYWRVWEERWRKRQEASKK